MARELTTTAEVMDALGGNPSVAELTGRTPKAVSNWRSFETFPSDTFLVMTEALHKRGDTAPSSLWRMVQVEWAS